MKTGWIGLMMAALTLLASGCVVHKSDDNGDVNGSVNGDDNSGTGHINNYPDGGYCGDGVVQTEYEICDHQGTRTDGPFAWECLDECQTEVATVYPEGPDGWQGKSISRVMEKDGTIFLAMNEKKDSGDEGAALGVWTEGWSYIEVGPHNEPGSDTLSALAFGADGYVWTGGRTIGVLGDQYDPSDKLHTYTGIVLNTSEPYDGWYGTTEFFSVSFDSRVYGLATLSGGDVVVSGSVDGDLMGSGDPSERPYAFLHRMTADGSDVWTTYMDILNPSEGSIFGVYASDLVVDEAAGVGYGVGGFDGAIVAGAQPLGRYDIVLFAFDLDDGTILWATNLGTDKKDVPGGLVQDPDTGDLIVVGSSDEAPWYLYIARVTSDGNLVWEQKYGTSAEKYIPRDVDLDSHGYLYVVGVTDDDFPFVDDPLSHHEAIGLEDAFLWVLSPTDGTHAWLDQFNPTNVDYCSANDVYVDRTTDTVYVGGWCRDDIYEKDTVAFLRAYHLFWED